MICKQYTIKLGDIARNALLNMGIICTLFGSIENELSIPA